MRKLTIHELGRLTPDEFRKFQKHRIVLVLDNIRSGLNVGSIFRTADAFAIEKILLCGITPRPPHREILKTALGATESVAWDSFSDAAEAVRHLQDLGFRIFPIEQTDQSRFLHEVNWKEVRLVAFVFGNEVEGVSDSVIRMLDESIEIPQYGTKHSLNVAVAAGIVLWDVLLDRIS